VGHAACAWNNAKEGISMPIFGILCYGVSFEFYKYDGSVDPPTFSLGRLSEGLPEPCMAFPLACLGMNTSPQPFIHSLRLVSEIIFDVFLTGYSSSLTAYQNSSMAKTAKTRQPRKSLGGWEGAIENADIAQQMFRDGEKKRQAGHIEEANADSLEAMRHLMLRYDFSLAVSQLKLVSPFPAQMRFQPYTDSRL
jgi:hypothetical protein